MLTPLIETEAQAFKINVAQLLLANLLIAKGDLDLAHLQVERQDKVVDKTLQHQDVTVFLLLVLIILTEGVFGRFLLLSKIEEHLERLADSVNKRLLFNSFAILLVRSCKDPQAVFVSVVLFLGVCPKRAYRYVSLTFRH